MSAKQNQDKLDKRAEALRQNLRKRNKPAKKSDAPVRGSAGANADATEQQDNKD